MALDNDFKTILKTELTGTSGTAGTSAKINETITNALTTVATDSLYSVTGTITGGSDDHDLIGSLEDPLGNAVTFAKVMLVFIRNKSSNSMTLGGTNNIPIMANTSDLINLAAGATFYYVDETGITVTATTGDLITITGTNGDTYDLIVVGSSS